MRVRGRTARSIPVLGLSLLGLTATTTIISTILSPVAADQMDHIYLQRNIMGGGEDLHQFDERADCGLLGLGCIFGGGGSTTAAAVPPVVVPTNPLDLTSAAPLIPTDPLSPATSLPVDQPSAVTTTPAQPVTSAAPPPAAVTTPSSTTVVIAPSSTSLRMSSSIVSKSSSVSSSASSSSQSVVQIFSTSTVQPSSTAPANSTLQGDASSGSHTGSTAGIVVGVLAAFVGLFLIAFFIPKLGFWKKKEDEDHDPHDFGPSSDPGNGPKGVIGGGEAALENESWSRVNDHTSSFDDEKNGGSPSMSQDGHAVGNLMMSDSIPYSQPMYGAVPASPMSPYGVAAHPGIVPMGLSPQGYHSLQRQPSDPYQHYPGSPISPGSPQYGEVRSPSPGISHFGMRSPSPSPNHMGGMGLERSPSDASNFSANGGTRSLVTSGIPTHSLPYPGPPSPLPFPVPPAHYADQTGGSLQRSPSIPVHSSALFSPELNAPYPYQQHHPASMMLSPPGSINTTLPPYQDSITRSAVESIYGGYAGSHYENDEKDGGGQERDERQRGQGSRGGGSPPPALPPIPTAMLAGQR